MSDRIKRVSAVLAGAQPDRTPVSFWHHFEPEQYAGEPAVRAHLDLLRTYDLDFLKIMNDNGYPCPRPIRALEDLDSLQICQGNEEPFDRQLQLVAALADQVRGSLLTAVTVFNPWTTLRKLVRPKRRSLPPTMAGTDDPGSRILADFLAADRARVQRALEVIAHSLAAFARRCLTAGADGVFLSVRDDWVEHLVGAATYDTLVRPLDLEVLRAVSGARFNLLHVCGRAMDFAAFARYPVAAINWADRSAGPSIAQAPSDLRPAVCGGVDNLAVLPDGTPEDVAAQVRDARLQAGTRPLIIAPGCTFDPQRVPPANLQAMCRAAREPLEA